MLFPTVSLCFLLIGPSRGQRHPNAIATPMIRHRRNIVSVASDEKSSSVSSGLLFEGEAPVQMAARTPDDSSTKAANTVKKASSEIESMRKEANARLLVHQSMSYPYEPACELDDIFKVWEVNGSGLGEVIKTLANGSKVCIPDSAEITIETMATSECINKVNLKLTKPKNKNGDTEDTRTEREAPYLLYANSGTDVRGRNLSVGEYSIKAWPNDDKGNAIERSFEIVSMDDSQCKE